MVWGGWLRFLDGLNGRGLRGMVKVWVMLFVMLFTRCNRCVLSRLVVMRMRCRWIRVCARCVCRAIGLCRGMRRGG